MSIIRCAIVIASIALSEAALCLPALAQQQPSVNTTPPLHQSNKEWNRIPWEQGGRAAEIRSPCDSKTVATVDTGTNLGTMRQTAEGFEEKKQQKPIDCK